MKVKKGKWIGVFIVVAMLVTMLSSVVGATLVEPVLFKDWTSGNARAECIEAGCNAKYVYKVDNWNTNTSSGSYTHAGNTITVTAYKNLEGVDSFDWESDFPVCAVIVKGGPSANVFYYDGALSDDELYAPINPNNDKNYDISHVTFCFNDPEECQWIGETAWAAGSRFVAKGNWATYTEYKEVEKQEILFAGQFMKAGTVEFSAVEDGEVKITITLNDGWRFKVVEEDDKGEIDENVKIQDYKYAPKGNPAPGLFAWKKIASGSSTTITVPANNFYGVHVDVEYCE